MFTMLPACVIFFLKKEFKCDAFANILLKCDLLRVHNGFLTGSYEDITMPSVAHLYPILVSLMASSPCHPLARDVFLSPAGRLFVSRADVVEE